MQASSSASSPVVAAGFADPVLDSQSVFRAVLEAMASPGTIAHVAVRPADAPTALPSAAAAALLALVDHETSVRLPARLAGDSAGRWLAFHTGAPMTAEPRDARFAVLDGREDVALAAFDPGEDRYPDRSATVLVLCEALEGGPVVILSGPGIEITKQVAPTGLRAGFWDEAAANSARFPLGVDFLFIAGERLFALPRSTSVALGGTR